VEIKLCRFGQRTEHDGFERHSHILPPTEVVKPLNDLTILKQEQRWQGFDAIGRGKLQVIISIDPY
jgi:hypothetical protein